MVTIESAVSKTGNALQLQGEHESLCKERSAAIFGEQGSQQDENLHWKSKINLLESQESLVSLVSCKNPKNLWYLWNTYDFLPIPTYESVIIFRKLWEMFVSENSQKD